MNITVTRFCGLVTVLGLLGGVMVGCRAIVRPGEPVAGFAVGTMKPGSSSLTVEEFRRAVETANSSIADQDTYLEAFRLVERLNSKDLGMAAMVVRRVYIPGGVQPYLYAIYRRWAAEDVPAALANARSIPDRNEGYVALTAVFKTWSARDPAAVSQWLHTQSSARDLTLLLQTATPGLTAASPETAFLLIQSLGPWSRNSNYLQGITEGWAKTKPREALARLETVQAYPELVQEVVSMWACKDFQAAETWVKSQPRGETRRAGECGLVAALVLDDPKRATGMALALPKGRHQGAAVHALLELWVQLDVVGAANWVKQLPLGSLRNTALEQVFYYWGVVRPWDALDSIQSIPAGPDRDMVLAKIAEAWSVVDTKALAEWLVKLPTGPSKKAAVSATIGMLMYANPAAAASLLGEAPKAIGRAHVLQIVGNWMEIDAPKAMEWVRSYPDTSVREEAYAKFAHSSWARQCPTQALAVLTELPPGRFQGEGFRTLVANWAKDDLDGALKWAMSQEAGAPRKSAMCALHEQWAAEDPEAAANYFHGQGEGGQPSGVLSSVMVTWGAADPVAAITWIMTLPGNEMERFLPSAVASWAGEDPVLAARYVLKFQSGEFRNRLIQEVVARWAMRDAESVAKWVSTNHFEEAVLVRAYPSIIFYWAQRNPDQASLWIDTLPEGMPRVKALEAMARALRENVVSP